MPGPRHTRGSPTRPQPSPRSASAREDSQQNLCAGGTTASQEVTHMTRPRRPSSGDGHRLGTRTPAPGGEAPATCPAQPPAPAPRLGLPSSPGTGSQATPPKSPSGKVAPTWRGVMGRWGGGEVELVLEVLLVLLLPLQAGLLPEAGGLLPADRQTDRHRDSQGGRARTARRLLTLPTV